MCMRCDVIAAEHSETNRRSTEDRTKRYYKVSSKAQVIQV